MSVKWKTSSRFVGYWLPAISSFRSIFSTSFPEAQARDISELIKGDLSLSAANGSEYHTKDRQK